MGVIKKLLFKGESLAKVRHKNLFLDMEENIHIHYRDLRIEFSRLEFEEFCKIFIAQASQLLEIIYSRNYQDGKVSNSNQDVVRIVSQAKLTHDVHYHPQRLSIEECGDGYHLHYRNYKLLISAEEFTELTEVFRSFSDLGVYAETYPEVLDLLHANEIDFIIAGGNIVGSVLSVSVANYHFPKVRDILTYIGFLPSPVSIDKKIIEYSGRILKVMVTSNKVYDSSYYQRLRDLRANVRLLDALTLFTVAVDANLINRIKSQVLNLYYAIRNGQGITVETNPDYWLYLEQNQSILFPYSPLAKGGAADADQLYLQWSAVLRKFDFSFVKPSKIKYSADIQLNLNTQVELLLRSHVASCGAVSKIYIMGSVIRRELGLYRSPFVHGKMAKLGSDIDILVEIDPLREAGVSSDWTYITAQASNFCAVYHMGEIPIISDDQSFITAYPDIILTHHLIDAYVHFPSRGHVEEKDAFLKKFGATLFYDRTRDGTVYANAEMEKIAHVIQSSCALTCMPAVEKMSITSDNALYKIYTSDTLWILKVFKVAGNYRTLRVSEHASYEARLIQYLLSQGVVTPPTITEHTGDVILIEDSPALLYQFSPGVIRQKPEYPLVDVCKALALIHSVQLESPVALGPEFTFDEACMIWLPQFTTYVERVWDDQELRAMIDQLNGVVQWHHSGSNRGKLFKSSPMVHCHGDVTPKNILWVGDVPWFFDFNNAYFAPKIVDVIDGAFEFSLAEKYVHLCDFSRFSQFIDAYADALPLLETEREDLNLWIQLIGIIKFTKELRMLLQSKKHFQFRKKRALAIAQHVLQHLG